MGASEKTQHAIRRSTRLPLEVPVLVTSLNAAQPSSVECQTTLVNAHGCGLISTRKFSRRTPVRIEIVSAKRHTTAQVADVVPLGGDPETWLIGLELDVAGNFWGIDYAPSDWRIEERIEEKIEEKTEEKTEESPAPAAEPKPEHDGQGVAAKPVRSRRWRLSDISAGACYLEATAPFVAGTPVLLSVRVSNGECLLDGIVLVSYAQSGMGIEFLSSSVEERRAKVEELIERLTSSHDVPRVLVGRREDQKEDRREDIAGDAAAAPKPVDVGRDAGQDAGSRDALLELIREGPSLTEEQFMNALRAQRSRDRRGRR
jgi:hypothetical protein